MRAVDSLLTILIALVTIITSDRLVAGEAVSVGAATNRLTYLNGHDECLIGHSFAGQITTRWFGQRMDGDVVLVDLSRVGRRSDLVLQAVRDYNLRRDPNTIVRWLPNRAGAAIVDVNGDGALDVITHTATRAVTHLWSPRDQAWSKIGFPVATGAGSVCWGVVEPAGAATILVRSSIGAAYLRLPRLRS